MVDQVGFRKPDGTFYSADDLIAGSYGKTPDSGSVGIHTGSVVVPPRGGFGPVEDKSVSLDETKESDE